MLDDDLLTLESFLSDYRERDWIKKAACRGMDTDLFFPERGESTREAKAVCETCTVRQECGEYGFMEKIGIWGGTTEYYRRRIRSQNYKELSTG
jgi:WhiB family redox-sensing transcriptional regulator